MKDGDAIPEGYTRVVRERVHNAPVSSPQRQGQCETVDLCTPPRVVLHSERDIVGNASNEKAAKRNLTRNLNRKANTMFAKDLKESLATGQPTTIKLPEDATHLKARWHAAAKEVAYKLLDLRKESWKEYSSFEKGAVHREIDARYKFDPPIEPHAIDRFLSCHLRSSRAVWKAHWVRYGDKQKHPNCPAEAWEKLIKWWCTQACQDEAAEMAKRRSKVQASSKTGRKSRLEKMDGAVSHGSVDIVFYETSFVVSFVQIFIYAMHKIGHGLQTWATEV